MILASSPSALRRAELLFGPAAFFGISSPGEPLTGGTMARDGGVDDFVAEAEPEEKIRIMSELQAQGHLVAAE